MTEQLQLMATVMPSTTTDKSLNWTSTDQAVATVDESGLVTAVGLGETTITVTTADGSYKSASCTVRVVATPAASVHIDYDGPTTVKIGFTQQLTATVLPATTTDKTLVWNSGNENVVHVESDGLISAIGQGETRVSVETTNGLVDFINFVVLPNPVEQIEVTTDKNSIRVGETTQLSAVVLPENATNKTISWDSDNKAIAVVDQNGVVTGVSVGEVDIKAKASDGSGVVKAIRIHVVATPVESLSIIANGSTILKDGENVTMTAVVTPSTATDTSVTWQSDNEEIATVIDGVVTAHRSLGVAHIKATAHNGVYAEAEVTVVETPVQSISINCSVETNELFDGESMYVSAQVLPTTATYPEIKWSVSDDTVISIDSEGKVTALRPGEAYIYAEASNGIRESLKIIVKPILIERIELAKQIIVPLYSEAGVKSQVNLDPIVYPENASNKALHWTSSDQSVGTVSPEGDVFRANGIGKTTLTCYAEDGSNVTQTTEVTVFNMITGIALNENDISLSIDQSFELIASVTPIDADYNASWESSNESVATVDDGIVEAVAEGECVITVSAASVVGPTYNDECHVTVYKESGLYSVTLDDVTIKVRGSQIFVENLASGYKASLFDLNGVMLQQQISNGCDIIFNASHNTVYIVSTGKFSLKVVVQ